MSLSAIQIYCFGVFLKITSRVLRANLLLPGRNEDPVHIIIQTESLCILMSSVTKIMIMLK